MLLTEVGDLHKTHWIPIVRSYSGRFLTKPSDKAVAFAAIVEELQASSDSSYFAGFWRKGLERQLLLKVPRETSAERPPTYQAPSRVMAFYQLSTQRYSLPVIVILGQ